MAGVSFGRRRFGQMSRTTRIGPPAGYAGGVGGWVTVGGGGEGCDEMAGRMRRLG